MEEQSVVQGLDTSRPNIARVYDYWLGGKENFVADRELAEKMLSVYPGIAQMYRDNRKFVTRAVTWAARAGHHPVPRPGRVCRRTRRCTRAPSR